MVALNLHGSAPWGLMHNLDLFYPKSFYITFERKPVSQSRLVVKFPMKNSAQKNLCLASECKVSDNL